MANMHKQDYYVTVAHPRTCVYDNAQFEDVTARYHIRAASPGWAARKTARHLDIDVNYAGVDVDCGQRRYDTDDGKTHVYVRDWPHADDALHHNL